MKNITQKNEMEHISKDLLDVWSGDALYEFEKIAVECGLINMSNVFHYTDISGFISIMQNHELWASHIYFMNDKSEYNHGKKLFQTTLNKLIECSTDEFEKQLFLKVSRSLNNSVSEGLFPISSKDVFSLSFSKAEDSLEMWRGYGKKSGIAISFERDKFLHDLPGMALIKNEQYEELLKKYDGDAEKVRPEHEQLIQLYNVIYDTENKEKVIRRMIQLGIDFFRSRKKFEFALDDAVCFLSTMIFFSIPLFKHEGFKGEEECRFVDHVAGSIKKESVHYRERNGIILPYIKYKMVDRNCRPLHEMPIDKIVVGPGLNQEKTVESVKYFLEKSGMEDLVEKVKASKIPYVAV